MATAKILSTDACVLQQRIISPAGPTMANHVGCIINDILYIHGGIDKKMSNQPLSKLYSLELESPTPIWQEIREASSPALSHHACVVMEDRYMVLVGGWDGKVRSSQVCAYDTQEKKWMFLRTSGFPEGAGLSSHTTTLLDDGRILVIGREGGARIQRRFGNGWVLSGSIKSGELTYTEHGLTLASRSGHTAHTVGHTLVIIGGRADNSIEMHSGLRSAGPCCDVMNKLAVLAKSSTPMTKPPCGRKQHVSASGAGAVLIHGGETFDGRSRDPVGDFYLVTLKPLIQWFNLGPSRIGRAGHICCISESRLVFHGGLGPKGIIYGDSYQIDMKHS